MSEEAKEYTTGTETQPEAKADAKPQKGLLGQAPSGDVDVPEKYRVLGADGALDHAASLRKLSEGYRHLHTRMGAGEAPPGDADGYAPEITKDGFSWEEMKKDPAMQGFLTGAHAKGLSNAQVSFVVQSYLDQMQAFAETGQKQQQEAAEKAENDRLAERDASMRKRWPDGQDLHDRLNKANHAVSMFANPQDMEVFASGAFDHPAIIELLANVAAATHEDTPPSGAIATKVDFVARADEIRKELASLPHWDKRRGALQAELMAGYEKKYPGHPA